MVLLEFKRSFFSKSTIVFLMVIIAISAISWGASLYEQGWILEQNYRFSAYPASYGYHIDYDGWTFLYNLWFNSVSTDLKNFFFYAWIGVALTSRLYTEKSNRFGNLVVTRQSYKQRFYHLLLAQSLYIITLIGIYVLISFTVSIFLGGIPASASTVATATYGWAEWLGIALLQFLWISFAYSVINAFCLLLNMWIKQKYILQLFPFILFVIVPAILWPVSLTLSPAFHRLISGFLLIDGPLGAFGFLFQDWGFGHFLRSAQTAIAVTVLIAILHPFHIRKGEKDYL